MSALSDYAENKVLNHMLGVEEFVFPTQQYIGLFVRLLGGGYSDRLETSDFAEEVGVAYPTINYIRKPITFSAATNGEIVNNNEIIFPQADGTWGQVTDLAIIDSDIVGNGHVLFYGAADTAKLILLDDIYKIMPGQIKLVLQ